MRAAGRRGVTADGGGRRRSSLANPKLGFWCTVWGTDCINAKRAGRRLRRRCGGAAGQRGGAGQELWRGHPVPTVHELDDKRRGRVAHLQAQVLDGFAMTWQRQRRGIGGEGG
jgi:hypothetical protein